MTILWLILKIILWVIGILCTLLLVIVAALLFLPICYDIVGQKQETMSGQVNLRLFAILEIDYNSKEAKSIRLKLFGLDLDKLMRWFKTSEATASVAEQQELLVQDRNQDALTRPKEKEKPLTQVPPIELSSAKKVTEPTSKISQKSKQKVGKRDSKKEKTHTKEKKEMDFKHIWQELQAIWKDEARKPFIQACKKLLISWWYALKPKALYFEVLFGLEDPAETGLWLAKLMPLYPVYAPYGNIMGDFEEARFEGCIEIRGKTNLFKFVYPVLAFVFHKEVRIIIKKIMHFGKDEENGIKTQ
ncbi:MAG: hypothetical protein RSD02_02820 [Niameybacter sp.]